MTVVQQARQATEERDDVPAAQVYRDIARILERMHRRYLDVVRVELSRVGIDDISPVQVLMLINISGEEVSVRDLVERGSYLGSNASYNLKQLAETGYIERTHSQRDRRSARIRLSEKGIRLCERFSTLDNEHFRVMARQATDVEDLEITYRTLRRLDRVWTDAIRYNEPGLG